MGTLNIKSIINSPPKCTKVGDWKTTISEYSYVQYLTDCSLPSCVTLKSLFHFHRLHCHMTFCVRKFVYISIIYCLQFLHKKKSKPAGNQVSYFSEIIKFV